ncbi:bifunctional diguanylate cyclase/phosphodiesterase [Pseudogulbenkiania ferrooxidans]|uniref:Diguanylate cyclase/phosphodiesterase with extracellular sensor n=1 Tax=Pseudogulbenkiania ferrooxidans 2002 TaxID=279714 RepID=B9YYD0_9NEIS|nr:LapD/MoxY N-terminal periplasmic domain-containing protein [Pseudogulbenkiania ferrooxidans]EEG10133.1 diguanylate cyclase/phosphodiesterase with extracellular sensor [Pseudogulbenkiania ferrooxidans 2002]
MKRAHMTLIEQVWLLVAMTLFTTVLASLTVSLLTARDYLSQQLYAQSVSGANALALSINQYQADPAMSETLINATFDNAHYRLIRWTGVDGKTRLERVNQQLEEQVPRWFQQLLPLNPRPASANLSKGWLQAGTITVEAQTSYAWIALWQGSLRMLAWLSLAALLTGALATVGIRYIRRQLHQVVQQAEAISERRFVTMAEPGTPELSAVARAMNTLSGRIKSMLDEAARHIDQLRAATLSDPLTGLANRSRFEERMIGELADPQAAAEGELMLVRLPDLAEANKRLGGDAVNRRLKHVASELQRSASGQTGWQAARLRGAEFVLLMPGAEPQAAERLATELGERWQEASDPAAAGWRATLGLTRYAQHDTLPAILLRANEAVTLAEQQSSKSWCRYDPDGGTLPSSDFDWNKRLREALADHAFRLAFYPVVNGEGAVIHQEGMITLPQHGASTLRAGTLTAHAARLGLSPALDQEAIEQALLSLAGQRVIAVNLSAPSLDVPYAFTETVRDRLQASLPQGKLALEWLEPGLAERWPAFQGFCRSIRPLGVRIGLEMTGEHFNLLARLHEVSLDYLVIDGALIRGAESDPGAQLLLSNLLQVARMLDLEVYAKGVTTSAEGSQLLRAGVDGITGPGVSAA